MFVHTLPNPRAESPPCHFDKWRGGVEQVEPSAAPRPSLTLQRLATSRLNAPLSHVYLARSSVAERYVMYERGARM